MEPIVQNGYSKDFPNPVIPKNVDIKWRAIYNRLFGERIKEKFEKWFESMPNSTMRDTFK